MLKRKKHTKRNKHYICPICGTCEHDEVFECTCESQHSCGGYPGTREREQEVKKES